ncbi:hypothetical protein [Parashewanella tropica]|uniref:hypothetical protein n=1 Tax=Parashewanella tropica TaxID=2547970 RepID=UPI0010598820|nr:hypothetical protein [Parashewanella tropica]
MKGILLSMLIVMFPAMANSADIHYGDWKIITSAKDITARSTSSNHPEAALSLVCSADHQNCFIQFSAQYSCKTGSKMPLYLDIDSSDGFIGSVCKNNQWKVSGYPLPFIQTIFDKLLNTRKPFSVTLGHTDVHYTFSIKGIKKAIVAIEGGLNNFSFNF